MNDIPDGIYAAILKLAKTAEQRRSLLGMVGQETVAVERFLVRAGASIEEIDYKGERRRIVRFPESRVGGSAVQSDCTEAL